MIEASIAEVDLTDTFHYGVQAALDKGPISVLSAATPASSLGTTPGGLSVAFSSGGVTATFDLLSTLTKVKVISSPKLMVLNNKSASIEVGDQVPIATSAATSTQSAGAPTINTIQLYDTGIILHVTPKVNSTGQVLLDLSQEVSASVPTSSSGIDSPTIQQRKVATSVAVDDGQTIVIGGLIRDNRSRNRTGAPVLKDIPVVGALFGVTDDNVDRTELMVVLTPHVVRNGREIRRSGGGIASKASSDPGDVGYS